MKVQISIFGHICIDKNKSEKQNYTAIGSPAFFMAEEFHNKNRNCTIFSHHAKNLHLPAFIQIYPSEYYLKKNLKFFNLSKKNKRIQKVKNTQSSPPVKIDKRVKSTIHKSDIIIVAPILSNYNKNYIENILNKSKKSALKILLAQGLFRKIKKDIKIIQNDNFQIREIFSLFDIIIFSKEDAKDIKKVLKRIPPDRKILISKGAQGVDYYYKKRKTHFPVKKIPFAKIKDSIGAGDIFAAAFIENYYLYGSIKKAVKAGQKRAGQYIQNKQRK